MRKKKSTKRLKSIKPDEVFSHGPLQAARFGKNIIWQSNWQEGQHAELQQRLVEQYPAIVEKINKSISQIEDLISTLPADKILHRAWWEKAMSGMHIVAESEVKAEDAIAMRMIDYVQSMIAATKPASTKKDEVSDEDWQLLCQSVEHLFETLNESFHLSATARRKAADDSYDDELEEFLVKSQFYWCNVRGDRYQVHQLRALEDILIPQSNIIECIFNIPASKLLEELSKIWHSLTFGLGEAFDEVESFRAVSLNAMEADIKSGLIDPQLKPRDVMAEVLNRHGLKEKAGSAFGKCFGMDLFDLQKVTELPSDFLEEFSWSAGQDSEFLAEGDFRGWPLKIWPTFKRPFIKIDNRFYCFDIHSLFDNFYRQMEKKVFARSEAKKQQWIKIRKDVSETLPLNYFKTILPSSNVIQETYYKWSPEPGKSKQWCELDALIICDDHLFVIEVKAGSFTYTSPAEDFPAYVQSLKNLVESPAKQGHRFLDYLNSADEVSIYDKSHTEILKIKRDRYQDVTLCAITQDAFTEIAAQIQHLGKIGVEIGQTPVWSMSIDDLRVYADIFSNPLEFLHYVKQRKRAFNSQLLKLEDELDHLGLYLKHNNYAQYASELFCSDATRMSFFGYRDEIDKYFHEKLSGNKPTIRLVQEMPIRLQELIGLLNQMQNTGRSKVADYLLDISSKWRNFIFQGIEDELKNLPLHIPRPLSTHGDVRLTVFPWVDPYYPADHKLAIDHAYALMLLNDEADRLIIELTYSGAGKLSSIEWDFLVVENIPVEDVERLKVKAESIRERRINRTMANSGKVGRNDSCPCGSGKKYKKCCLLARK